MPVTPVNYTRKGPDLQVIRFDTSDIIAMQDLQNWVTTNLPPETEVTLRTSMGGLLFWPGVTVRPGEYVAKDSNGKLFKLEQDDLDKFFDAV